VEEGKALPLCPRCGAPYRSIEYKTVSGRTYAYAYHGKVGRRPVLCYLGPVDSYVHVEHIFALDLRNLESVNLLAVAYNAASLYAALMRRRGEQGEAAERLRRLAEDILLLAGDLVERSLDEEERE